MKQRVGFVKIKKIDKHLAGLRKRKVSIHKIRNERWDIVQMSILSKIIYRFNTVPLKIPMILFKEIEKQF